VLPPATIEEAGVHPVEVGSEESSLVTTGAGPDLDDGGAVIQGVGRHEQRLELSLDLGLLLLDALDFCAGLGSHLCVVNDNELARLRELVIEFLQAL